jgi:hypothetical protein
MNMEWIKEFHTNSCDIIFVKYVDEKFDQLFEYEKGGITYLNIPLDEMFTMSNMVIMLLQKYLKQFAQEGLTRVPNEDVQLCLKQIAAVCVQLAKVDALPQEAPGCILEGFIQYLVVEFRDIHKLLATTNKVCHMQAVSGRRGSTTTLAAVHKLCSKANEVFHSLNLTNEWNIPQSHRADAFVTVCYNCGSPDHNSDKCPLPRNEAKTMKAKVACPKYIAEGCASGSCGHSGCGDDCTNSRGKGGANGGPATPGTNASSGDGVERNGSWMTNCKSCGWNDTHTSKYRSKWN